MNRVAKLFLLFVAVSLLTRAYMIPVEVIDIDESAHITGSRVMMNGGLLYTDFVDNKPPLLYVYYALAQIVFGRGLVAVHLFTVLLVVPLTALACSAFFNHDRRGILAALLFLVSSAAFLAHDMHASNAELLMILPGAWAIALLRDEQGGIRPRRLVCAGVLLGTGVLLKYQVGTWVAAAGIACTYESIRRKQFVKSLLRAGLLAVAVAVPLALVCVWFWLRHGLDSMLFWNWGNNLRYSANPIQFREALGRFSSYFLPFIIVTVPLWYFAVSELMRPALRITDYQRVLLGSLLLVSVIPVFLGFRFYPHYFIQLYIPLCLLAAPRAATLLDPLTTGGRWFVVYLVAAWGLFAAVNAWLYYGNSHVYRETDPVFAQVAKRLKSDPCFERATLFVWGYSPIYYYAGLPPASRFAVLSQSGLTGYISGNMQDSREEDPMRWNLLISDLEKNRATFIVDTSPAGIFRWNRYPIRDFPLLENYLQKNYEQIADVEGVVLYRRQGCVLKR